MRPWHANRTDVLRYLLLGVTAILFALHFLHLKADFPNDSPWMDWSKYTDEGWYGDAAIRHYLTGHWYWKGDFNPAVALPVWPALEWVWFGITGVSPSSARVLTLLVFAATLAGLYRLTLRCARMAGEDSSSLAAPLVVFLLVASPFFYVFERMAILEPLLIALTVFALLCATHVRPFLPWQAAPGERSRSWAWALALGGLLPAMVLTKTTAVVLFPAAGYLLWARAGYRLRPAARSAVVPLVVAAFVWLAYFGFFVRPHYLEDYRYLFSANAYTGWQLEPLATVIWNTLADGMWMGKVLYPLFFLCLLELVFAQPWLWRNPLLPALLLWIGGYTVFLAYHNNLQPRYYLMVATPITLIVAILLDRFARHGLRSRKLASALTVAAVLAVAIPDIVQQLDFVLHPTYEFEAAAQGIKRIVTADSTHSHLVLSISGSDLTLMTGLPSIDDDFGTLDLGERVRQYRPGWYASWNELDDDKMEAITPLYHPVRVAEFPAMDDPERNLLILYRLDPAEAGSPQTQKKRRKAPKQLQTRLGQQPSTTQLVH
jgi:4-amino-4-deoxy-L-arabinose transferase-like glycosyltransferase